VDRGVKQFLALRRSGRIRTLPDHLVGVTSLELNLRHPGRTGVLHSPLALVISPDNARHAGNARSNRPITLDTTSCSHCTTNVSTLVGSPSNILSYQVDGGSLPLCSCFDRLHAFPRIMDPRHELSASAEALASPNTLAHLRPVDLGGSMLTHKPSCVVLGGGGFIGTNLCRRLAQSGHRVRAFGRRGLFQADLKGVEWYPNEFTDAESVAAAIASFDVVFHLVHATMPQAADLDMVADLQNNVVPTIALLDHCRRAGVKRVVFASSGGTVYGNARQIPTPETAPTDPICAYGISKLAIEKYLALFQHLHGLDFRVLRITNPFGPFQVALKNQGVIAALIARALRDETMEIWGDGSVVRDFIFVEDVVDAFLAAATDQGDKRIYNIGSGQGRSLCDIIAAIEHLMGMKLKLQWKPGRPLDVPVSVVATNRAANSLGWVPKTSFETGLKSTIEWATKTLSAADGVSR
jgi:UDP-glucose 4-epimerase